MKRWIFSYNILFQYLFNYFQFRKFILELIVYNNLVYWVIHSYRKKDNVFSKVYRKRNGRYNLMLTIKGTQDFSKVGSKILVEQAAEKEYIDLKKFLASKDPVDWSDTLGLLADLWKYFGGKKMPSKATITKEDFYREVGIIIDAVRDDAKIKELQEDETNQQ